MKNQIRITDGYERTVDILSYNGNTFQAIMFEASSDYNDVLQFKTKNEAKQFAENWVFRK